MTDQLALAHGPTAADHSARLRSRALLTGFAGVLSGLGIVLGHLLSVPQEGSSTGYLTRFAAHSTSGVIGGLATTVGAFLIVPALVGVLGLVPRRGSALATAGAVLAGAGALALAAGDAMIVLVMGALVHTHHDLAAGVVVAANHEPLLGLPFVFAPLLVLGMVLVGVALIRARTVPVWLGVLTILGAVLIPVSTSGGPFAALVLTPLGAALVLLGITVARRA